ncbi:disease resistance protein RPP2B-like [Gossypium hirsutum]|uniref:Disease resistance protein RPP2B-like n=1 Tax=Gossypium hirsutum TaxID=3635 RepID=A0ABM3AZZ6_GOSHI|nr:disease resistance protein RPP2B-like [Gossypium hirsutum]
MNLRGSQNLIKTPDFTTASNLEVLILEGCAKLVDVHPSIRVLKSIKHFTLRDCKSLRTLPTKIGMESLETLIPSGCSSLVRFPEIDGKMEHLKTLHLSGCYKVENLQQAKFLEELDLSLNSLTKLNLRDCNLCEGDILRDISGLSSLISLDLSGNNFISIPASLIPLSKLEFLILSNCNMCTLGEADTHIDISGLSSLMHLHLSGNNFITIPLALTQLSKLYSITLSDCKMLKSLPELPTSIGSVIIDDWSSLEVVASPSKGCNLVGGDNIRAINCFKLAEKINALALLKEHIKALPNSRKWFDNGFFDIMMPGSEIPEWFSQQKSTYQKQMHDVMTSKRQHRDEGHRDKQRSLEVKQKTKTKMSIIMFSHLFLIYYGLQQPLFNLKIMNLRGSQNLIKTPDFTTASNLEVLILEGCTKLVDVHPSIRVLKSLKLLNLRDCKSLRTLPTKIGMESLETLILSGCSSLVRFPEINWKMERLKTLDLSGCYRVENLLENLQQANGRKGPSYKLLPSLPSLFKVIQGRRTNPMGRMLPLLSGLSSLRELKLRDCNLCEGDIPPDISGLSCLEILDLSGNNFVSIPASLTRLSKLAYLILSNCNLCTFGEADTHSDISGLSSLSYLNLSGNNFISIPASLTRLSKLKSLELSNCNMCILGEADTHSDISGLSSLSYLYLSGNNFISILLELSGCKMLKSLPELPTSIGSVTIDDCSSLEVVASPSKVCNLVGGESIDAINCFKLAEKINALALLKEHIKVY